MEFTAAERRLLQLIAGGASNKQSAKELGVSLRTLELRRQRIMIKLGSKSAFQLGYRYGMIERSEHEGQR